MADIEITGPNGTKHVGQGGRNNRVGWVVYGDEPEIGDPVFSTKREAVAWATETVNDDSREAREHRKRVRELLGS